MSRQLQAVLTIFNCSEELRTKTLPYVNLKDREIYWPNLLRQDFSSGHRSAINFAYTIWTGGYNSDNDPFIHCLGMDRTVAQAVLTALAIWFQVVPPEAKKVSII